VIFMLPDIRLPIIVTVRSKPSTVFVGSNTGIVGSNPTQRHGCLCVRLFCVCAILYVQVEALRRADTPSKGSYQLCKRSKNRKTVNVQQRVVEQ
jgi:hypothetical protein